MTDEEFLHALDDRTIDPRAFNHDGHIRAAYLVLRAEPTFGRALDRMAELIKRFAAHHGNDGLYHETITVAFMALINSRMKHTCNGRGWRDFRAANPDLFEAHLLERYYDAATLRSPLARTAFILPGTA